jgi:hypothetical protein
MADESRDGLRLRSRREAPFPIRRGPLITASIDPPGTRHRPQPDTGLPDPSDTTGRGVDDRR